MLKCDFCSDLVGEKYKRYPCKDFVPKVGGIVEDKTGHTTIFNMAGDWCGCLTCSDLIDKEQWDELLERSAQTFMEKNVTNFTKDQVKILISELHREFRENRKP